MGESKNLWGGRFKGKSDPGFATFNNSFRFDRRLFAADVVASIAYCKALLSAGGISNEEATAIENALANILQTGQTSSTYFNDPSAEDIHSFVEARFLALTEDED